MIGLGPMLLAQAGACRAMFDRSPAAGADSVVGSLEHGKARVARQWTITKGLRRLWIVATIGWVIFATLWFVVGMLDQDQSDRRFARGSAEVECSLPAHAAKDKATCEREQFDFFVSKLTIGLWKRTGAMIGDAGLLVAFAFVIGGLFGPPLLLLGLVVATYKLLTWIARGFISPGST